MGVCVCCYRRRLCSLADQKEKGQSNYERVYVVIGLDRAHGLTEEKKSVYERARACVCVRACGRAYMCID